MNHNKIIETKKNKTIFILLFLILLLSFIQLLNGTENWEDEQEIIKRIVIPHFLAKTYNITDYGAVGDGITDCTRSFKSAIEECSKYGGGKVIVPKGTFLTGAVHLMSNVNLYVSKDAIIKFSTDPKKYLPVVFTRWEGTECMNYSPLIYAYKQENIGVTGEGILDGSASDNNWWQWKGKKDFGWKSGEVNQNLDRETLLKMGDKDIPVKLRIFGEGHYLRPSFFQPYRCKNILIEGVTFKNSPMWFLNPVLCTSVTIKNIVTEGLGPNNDGCDPESSNNVLIKGCRFNNGDDCIAIKSGRNNDGRRVNVPSENIVVQDCKMQDGHGGVVIGSEISGGAKNIFVSNCTMDSPNLDRAIRLKTNSIRGGVIENLFVRDVTVGRVKEAAIRINYYYEEGDKGDFTPVIRNIFIKNMKCNKSPYAVWIKAYKRSPVTNLTLENCSFHGVDYPNVIENVKDIHIKDVTINDKPMVVQ
jgi:polygalacturonase